jgi:MFS family permease
LTHDPAGDGAAPKRRPLYYGWYIVLASFLASLSYSAQLASVLGIFIKPMTEELGWSRTALAGAQSATRFVEGVVAPFMGRLIDRYGPRPLMIFGGILGGIGFMLLSGVHTLLEFYFLRSVVISIAFASMGYLVTSVAISNWFVRKRGRALALAGMGSSVMSTILPPVAVLAMAQWGWRPLWIAFGAFTLVSVTIPAAIWMRRRPEDIGLRPDGDPPYQAATVSTDPQEEPRHLTAHREEPLEPVWSRRETLRTQAFWVIIGSYAIAGLSMQGINISLIPLVEDQGFGAGAAALALSIRALLHVVLSPLAGVAADRWDPKAVRSGSFVIQGLAAIFFMIGGSLPVLYFAIFLNALGGTIASVTSEVIWAQLYGRLTLGVVRSLGAPLLTVVSATGPVFMNLIFDLTGSYQLAFGIFVVLFMVSAVAILFLRTPVPSRFARASEYQASN